MLAEVEEVIVVASNLAGGETQAGVFESLGLGMDLREQAGLELLGDFQFLSRAAFSFELLGEGAAMSFDAARSSSKPTSPKEFPSGSSNRV